MARKKRHEEHTNHEAWAIPYGDLITLLLAFFVVMYALSSVNEGKYRVLSDSLVAAFRGAPRSLDPIQIGDVQRSQGNLETERQRTLVPFEIALQEQEGLIEQSKEWQMMRASGMTPEEIDEAVAEIDSLSKLINKELAELIEQDKVDIRRNDFWLEVEINTEVLFPVGSASLAPGSLDTVRRLGEMLAATGTRIQVEGHTDDLPISTPQFPSNWELSAARAATVVRMFAQAGVDPSHMAALGLAEYQPVEANTTTEGRAANRRVVIVILAGGNGQIREDLRQAGLNAAN